MTLLAHTVGKAARRVLRDWPFALLVTTFLAVGIASNTAVFSLLDAVLLEPLPYPAPEEILAISSVPRDTGGATSFVAAQDFFDWREQADTLEGLSAYMLFTPVLTGAGDPENLNAAAVTPGFFSVLRLPLTLGRPFTDDDGVLGRNNYAILTHGLWQRRFGGDPGVLGKTIRLDDEDYEVVGVTPREHEIPSPRIHVYLPLAFAEEGYNRQSLVLNVIARRHSSVSLEEVRAEMDTMASRLAQQYPETNAGRGVRVVTFLESRVGDIRPVLLGLQIASFALVLMISINVAGLLFSRALSQRKEKAIRQALGAGSWTLIRESLAETSLLCLLGGIAALPTAAILMKVLIAISPDQIPRIEQAGMDGQTLGFALLLTAVVALVCGLLPALASARGGMLSALQGTEATIGSGRSRGLSLGSALVIAEVALALGLLVGAGLLLRSLHRIETEPKGFSAENLLVVQVSLSPIRYPNKASVAGFFQELLPRLEALPAARSAAAVSSLPLQGGVGDFDLEFEIEEQSENGAGPVRYPVSARIATPSYFRTLGIPLLAGRDLSENDRDDRPPVVVVNETMARRYWTDASPVGERIRALLGGGKTYEIVGVVGDTRYDGLEEEPKPELYWSYLQAATPFASVVLRTESDPEALIDGVQQTIWRMDPEQAIYRVITMEDLVRRSVAERRWNLRLLATFSLVALLLTGLGIYGVMARNVGGRRHEIGVRMALGADRRSVQSAVVGQACRLALVGMVLGIGLALGVGRLLNRMLYGVSSTDLPTFLAAILALAAAAFLGSLLPALRAARTDPAGTLRAGT